MSGTVGILNVGAGDTKLSFDPSNPVERIRAARIVRDMLRRGYALLVEVERDGVKKFERALDFREDTCEYVIADFDPSASVAEPAPAPVLTKDQDHAQEPHEAAPAAETPAAEAAAPRKRGRPAKLVPAEKSRAVAVAPTAGG